MMKQQILVKLQTKYAGLQKKFLELLSEKLAKKVQDESGIDDAIAALDNAPISVEDMAKDFQRYGDSRVTDAQREWETKNKKGGGDADDDDADDDDADDDDADAKPKQKNREPEKRKRTGAPKWAREMMDEFKAFKTEKVKGTYKEKVKERLMDVPERFYRKWTLPTNDDELEKFVTDAETEYMEFVQEQKNAGIAIGTAPGRNTDTSGKTGSKISDKIVQADIDRYAERNKKLMEAAKKTEKTAQ